jgi:hypothetical protein
MSIPVPQPVQPATDVSESDYWLGFEALQKYGYKLDLSPIDPGLAAKMQAQHEKHLRDRPEPQAGVDRGASSTTTVTSHPRNAGERT